MNIFQGLQKMGENSKIDNQKRIERSRTAEWKSGTAKATIYTEPFEKLKWGVQAQYWFEIGEQMLSEKRTLNLWEGYDYQTKITSIRGKQRKAERWKYFYPGSKKNKVYVPRYVEKKHPDMNWNWYNYAAWLPYDDEFKLAPWMKKIYEKYEYVNGHPMWMTTRIKELNKIENLRQKIGFAPNTRFNWLAMGYILVGENQWGYVGPRNVYDVLKYSNGDDFLLREDIVSLNKDNAFSGLNKEDIKKRIKLKTRYSGINYQVPIMKYRFKKVNDSCKNDGIYTVPLDEKIQSDSGDIITHQDPGDPDEYILYEHPIFYSPFGHNVSIFDLQDHSMVVPPLLCGYIQIDDDKYVPVGTDISLDYRKKIGQTDEFVEAYNELIKENEIRGVYPYCKVLRRDEPKKEKEINPYEAQSKVPEVEKERTMDIELPNGYFVDSANEMARYQLTDGTTVKTVLLPELSPEDKKNLLKEIDENMCADVVQMGVYYGLYGQDMLDEI